jgi:Protein of unknown function (DUF3618)
MGKEPGEIREEIEDTRARMGETVEAIGYKADVKTRVKDSIADKKDAAVSKVTGAMPDTGEVKHKARRSVRIAKENPLGLAIGGTAVGFLVGLALPSTRLEDERIGEKADQVKDAVRETGQEALDRGKEVAREAADSAAQAAKERGSAEAEDLTTNLRESAREQSSVQASSSTSGDPDRRSES